MTATALVAAALAGDLQNFFTVLEMTLVIDILVWMFFFEPRILYSEAGVEIRNPLRVFRAEWAAVTGFDTRYGLGVIVDRRPFVAWSAPAPTRRQVSRIERDEFRGTEFDGAAVAAPGVSLGSQSGSALALLSEAKNSCSSESARHSVTMNWYGVAGLILATVLSFLAFHN